MGSCFSSGPSDDSKHGTVGRSARIARQDSSENSGNVPLKSGSEKVTSNPTDSRAPTSEITPSSGQSKIGSGRNNSRSSVSENPVDIAASDPGSSKEVKVLLLGSGESGKSTIVKQMKIIHQGGYTKEELQEHTPFVYKNILDCIKNVLNAIGEIQPSLINRISDLDEPEPEFFDDDDPVRSNSKGVIELADVNAILNYDYVLDSEESFDRQVADCIKRIYNTPEVQHFMQYQQRYFYLIDSTHYLLSNIDRIVAPGYVPSVNDVLRTRKKTSGIFHFRFQTDQGSNIHMYDVGGQRSERKKWIHCFDNVTIIIFCVALSEYDQVLLEEGSQNRLEESLALFDSVVNSRWFARTSIVLFLNKFDVLESKLPYSPMEAHFPDYTGGQNVNNAAKYILWRFTQTNRSGLTILPHVTEATDTSNIQLVFAAVEHTILENSLKDSGIL